MEYTEQQRQAIYSLEPRICVDAGAGSGKTRVLVDRIVHLLEKDLAPLEAIVAITFTDKAAGEMKQRLRSAFRDRADVNDPEVMTRWRGLERQLEYARISTIHSFCTALLRENALRLGLDPDFRVMAESESRLLRGEVVNRVLHELIEAEDADMFHAAATLTLPQTEQMMHGLLNRRGLLHRLARRWPLDDPTKLCREWAKTATQERERRLKALKHDPKVRSFLRRLQQLTGLCQNPEDGREQRRERFIRNFLALLEAKSAQQIQRCLDEFLMKDGINGYAKHWLTPARFKEITELQTAIVKWADSLAKQEETDETLEGESAVLCCAVLRVFAQMDRAYAEDKRENAAYDFDDLIEMTVRALGDNPALRARVAGSIQFLLIDEFQDTDGVQAEIVERLAREPGGPRLFVVGDAKQSIYYFRGAELGVFQEARGAASQLLPLGQNFRSLPEILEFVNDFFRGSGLLDNLGEFLPMSTHRPRQDGQRIEFLITPGAEDGQRKIMEDCRRAEAALIAGRILELCEGNAPLPVFGRETKAFRPATFGDVAILFRSLTDAYLYEDALRRARIPYQLMQGRGFYRRQEFLDVLNLLKVVIDPWNEAALLAFLRSPFAGLSDEDLFWLTRREGLAAAFHANRPPKEMAEPAVLEPVRALVHTLRANMDMPLPAYLRWILEVSGFEAVLLAQFNGVQKASNVRKLVDLALEFSRHAPASLYSYVKYLDEAREESLREGEAVLQPESAGAVLIMSIHQAKGLEFPIVFIPDMDRDQRGSNKDSRLLHRDLGVGIK
ncbi:MAG: UvrD-helicase domain-containing protein, partial [Candidatus Hydrogenedentes bacterium]|nr:UvrD-helicase domain-containing protein [Candidatus Hydrogenedentota bacterium]